MGLACDSSSQRGIPTFKTVLRCNRKDIFMNKGRDFYLLLLNYSFLAFYFCVVVAGRRGGLYTDKNTHTEKSYNISLNITTKTHHHFALLPCLLFFFFSFFFIYKDNNRQRRVQGLIQAICKSFVGRKIQRSFLAYIDSLSILSISLFFSKYLSNFLPI